jgi:aminoglycoside 6'-N-acetyltransferase
MITTDVLPRKTKRIALRRLTTADLEEFQAYRSDPKIGQYQGWTPMSDGEARAFLAEMEEAELLSPGKWCQIAIAASSTNNLLGDIGVFLSEDQDEAEIGFTLSSTHQGKGLATEAVGLAINLIFEKSKASLIKGITDSRNQPSINTLERLGMCRTESLQATFRGESCIEYVYVLRRYNGG